jgi:hypothetical protein
VSASERALGVRSPGPAIRSVYAADGVSQRANEVLSPGSGLRSPLVAPRPSGFRSPAPGLRSPHALPARALGVRSAGLRSPEGSVRAIRVQSPAPGLISPHAPLSLSQRTLGVRSPSTQSLLSGEPDRYRPVQTPLRSSLASPVRNPSTVQTPLRSSLGTPVRSPSPVQSTVRSVVRSPSPVQTPVRSPMRRPVRSPSPVAPAPGLRTVYAPPAVLPARYDANADRPGPTFPRHNSPIASTRFAGVVPHQPFDPRLLGAHGYPKATGATETSVFLQRLMR